MLLRRKIYTYKINSYSKPYRWGIEASYKQAVYFGHNDSKLCFWSSLTQYCNMLNNVWHQWFSHVISESLILIVYQQEGTRKCHGLLGCDTVFIGDQQCFYKMLVITYKTWHHKPENHDQYLHCQENFKSYIKISLNWLAASLIEWYGHEMW